MSPRASIEVRPVTPDRWDDLVRLFGPRGVSGCWCMWWRLSAEDASAYTGVPKMFLDAGFREVERRTPGRPIMRKRLRAKR